jgi:CubicO group peptidase (beta-lactamase class C family)
MPTKNTFLPLAVIACLIIGCSNPSSTNKGLQSDDNTLVTRLDSIGKAFIEKGEIMGLSLAIMKSKDTLFNKGFGFKDIERTQPITNETRFLMASISKLIGATLVMKLVEEGKLSLNQTLGELLPDFPNQVQAQTITLRHMLSHTSGLQDYASEIDSVYVRTGIPPTKTDFYNFFKDKELLFEPGSNYSYCNSGFLLMGMIVEKVSGNSFQQEIDRIINNPTNIQLELIASTASNPQMSNYFELKDSTFIPYPFWTWIKGDGGLTATAIELAQFPYNWANAKIIKENAFIEMTKPITLTDGITTGYGLGVRNGIFYNEKIIGHTGGHKSTYSIMVYFPERDLSFVIFINTDNSPTSVREIFGEFARAVLSKPIPDYRNSTITSDNLSVYEGSYGTFDYKTNNLSKIELRPNNSFYYCIGQDCERMYPMGNHKFWIEKWPYDYVEFGLNEDGHAVVLKEFYTGFYAILRKRI